MSTLRIAVVAIGVGAMTGGCVALLVYVSLDWWQRRVEARTLPAVVAEAESWLQSINPEGA